MLVLAQKQPALTCRCLWMRRPFDALEAAFIKRSVLCIRDQALTADQYLAFARGLGPGGPCVLAALRPPRSAGHHACLPISRKMAVILAMLMLAAYGTLICPIPPTPPRATLLHALETPVADGRSLGATAFASAEAAFAGLDEATKALILGQTAVHRVSGRRKRTGHRRWRQCAQG